jgi:hypothetical protein
MEITLIIFAVACSAMNVLQYMERRIERNETNRIIAKAARIERERDEMEASYKNEKLHREWAIGRIKDQDKVIKQLERNIRPRRKEASHESN